MKSNESTFHGKRRGFFRSSTAETHFRTGRLWEDRFKSVIVEDCVAAKTISAYIDLNSVCAGMVKDPADCRWSSYGEAIGGGSKGNGKTARAGLVRALRAHKGWAVEKSEKPTGRDARRKRSGRARVEARRTPSARLSVRASYRGAKCCLSGEVFHGRGGDPKQVFRERGVCERPRSFRKEGQGQGRKMRGGCGRDGVESEGFEEGSLDYPAGATATALRSGPARHLRIGDSTKGGFRAVLQKGNSCAAVFQAPGSSMKPSSLRIRVGWRIFRRAFASI